MSTEIDIEEIMTEIRKDIRERGISNDAPSFQDVACESPSFIYEKEKFIDLLNQINSGNNIYYYRELTGCKLKIFIKKVIRKMISFIVAPMAEDQNMFNVLVTREFNQLAGYVTEQEDIIDSYRKEIELLHVQLEEMNANHN